MATTPSVVPMARTSFWAPVTPETVGCSWLDIAANASIVAMTITLLRMGANMGAANLRCAFRSPMITAPSP